MLKMLKLGIFKKGIATKNYPAEPYLPPAGSMGEPSVETGAVRSMRRMCRRMPG